MFYCIDILRKNGKFGIIWLAATRDSGLKKRNYLSVDTKSICHDLIDYILHQGKTKPRLSLYLSSQLTYGTVKVYNKQVDYLLNDVLELVSKLRHQPQFKSIDCSTPKRKKGSKFEDASLLTDFNLLDDLAFVHTLDPHNFWQPELLEGETGEGFGEVSRHTVPLENITMTLDAAIIDQQLSNPVGLMEDMDYLPPLPVGALFDGLVDSMEETSVCKQAPQEDQREPGALTRAENLDLRSRQEGHTVQQQQKQTSTHDQAKATPEEEEIRLASLVTPPVRKRKRRRKMVVVDVEMKLSKKHLQDNIVDSVALCREKVDLYDVRCVPVKVLMQRSGNLSGHLLARSLVHLFSSNLITTADPGEDDAEDEHVTQLHERNSMVQGRQSVERHAPGHCLKEGMVSPMMTSTAIKSKWDSSLEVQRDASVSKDLLLEHSKSLLTTSSVLKQSSNIQSSINLSSPQRTSERSSQKRHGKENVPDESMAQHDSHYNTFFIDQLLKEDANLPDDGGNLVTTSLQPTPARVSKRVTQDFQDRLFKEISEDGEVVFKHLLPASVTRGDVAKCSSLLLEGVKDKRWRVRQDQAYADIFITAF